MKKIISLLFFVSLTLSILLTVVDTCCFDRDFYKREYEKSGTAEMIGVSEENLLKLTDTLFDYLKNEDKTLNIRLMVQGKVQEVFSDRAKLHMVDVRNLYHSAMTVRNISAVLSLIFALLMVILKTERIDLLKSYIAVLRFETLLFGAMAIFAAIDFRSFWIGFHEIFFDNDLYFLSENDVLVNMVNDTFFFDLVIKIIAIVLILFVFIYIVLRLLNRRNKNENQCRIV